METSESTRPDMLTEVLQQFHAGDRPAHEALLQDTIDELKMIARTHIHRRGCDGKIGATSLLQDAVVKLLQRNGLASANRAHFFFLMRRAIRDVLAERVRSMKAQKRGGEWRRVPIMEIQGADRSHEVTGEELTAAIEALESHDSDSAGAFLLIEFYGATIAGAAEALGRTFSQVRDDRDYAESWLRRFIDRSAGRSESRDH